MTIGIVVSFFDFRNDVRRLIKQLSAKNKIVLFAKAEHIALVRQHVPDLEIEIRVIDERKSSFLNRIIEQLFFFFKNIPKSKSNFYLMEVFKASNLSSPAKVNYALNRLYWVMRLPKVFHYDRYLSLLRYKSQTNIKDINQFVFFTEIADDYLYARLIKENKSILTYVYSWDHPCKHTRFSNKVKYLCWSEGIKKDIADLQNINADHIKVWGGSQFSYVYEYLNSDNNTRSKRYPFRYIYYVCAIGIDKLVPAEIGIIKELNQLINKHLPGITFVVRPYPILKNWELYVELQKEGIVLDDGFKQKDLSITDDSINDKFAKIEHAELLLHLGTTLGLEASFFQTPSLLIDFGYDKKSNAALSIKNFIHQFQNDKYLAMASPEQYIDTEGKLIQWLMYVKEGSSKAHTKNSHIASEFKVDSFKSIAASLEDYVSKN